LAIDNNGNLFWVTADTQDIFEMSAVTHSSVQIASVDNFDLINGGTIGGLTLDAAGNLFGTTSQGGANGDGAVFELAPGTKSTTVIADFTFADPSPEGGVVIDASGDLFGTTNYVNNGGANQTVFEIPASTGTITTLASWSGSATLGTPYAGLTIDSNGNLLGTVPFGGQANYGTVFELSTSPFHLAFTSPPVSTAVGSVVGGGAGIQVSVLYPWGNLVTTDSSIVTMTYPSYRIPPGFLTDTLVTNGMATFSNITLQKQGTYIFTATDGSYTAVISAPMTIGAPVTAWNFDTSDKTGKAIPAAASTSPDPSTGSGTAGSIGMNLITGPDTSAVVTGAGSSDAGTSNQAWRIAGNNGWNSAAPIASQGAQFFSSTVGKTGVFVQFDLNPTLAGEGNLAVEYTTDGGNTWNDAPVLSTNGDAGISVLSNTTSPNTILGRYFAMTGGALWYNRLTADFTGIPGVANNPNFGVRLVNASTGADCVNATGQAFNNASGIWAFDEVDISGVLAPAIVSVTPEDNAGNGVAAGSAAKGQRSMETQIAVAFNEAVNLASGAFTLGLVNQYGSGANDGSPDTQLSGILGTPSNPSGDGLTWIIPITSNGTNSYDLKGTQGGISGASLNNGVYQLNVVAADVTAIAGGTAMASNYTSAAWHRLYGDVDNARREFNVEYSAFLAAFSSTYAANGATNYNQDLDYDGDGRVFNSDYSAFLADFSSAKPYTEPQS
jgi:uncharacterized repeat protein (TIGR03803 family)